MDRGHNGPKADHDLDQWLKQAFGKDDDTLLKDFLLAQTEIKDNQIPPEPEDGFARLLTKIEERRIRPHYNETAETNTLTTGQKRVRQHYRRIKPFLRIAVAVSALAALLLAMGMTVGAKRGYQYNVTERENIGSNIVYNKGTVADQENMLEEAYQEISTELGSDVLRMGYIPDRMEYKMSEISKSRATMYFEYKGKKFYIVQQIRTEGSSLNYLSDKAGHMEVYNPYMDADILIEKEYTEKGELELSVQIISQDSYYLIMGVVGEEEFKKIIENVYIREAN